MVRAFLFRRSIGERLLFSALALISICLLPVFALAQPLVYWRPIAVVE